MPKSILFLTDLTNGETEDLLLVDHLKKKFDVTVSYFDKIEPIEDNFDLIMIRDTWPSDEQKHEHYEKIKNEFLSRAKAKNLKLYNDFNASADRYGKDYLVELFKKGYPVIPTVDSLKDINKLPKSEQYLIKPKHGFSSAGVKVLTCPELKKLKGSNIMIQPKLEFKYEISFYYVNKEFMYCLIFEPSKFPLWPEPKLFNPSKEDLTFAKKFVSWNKLENGIQRIDAVRLLDGSLLLLEIEDDSPYFSLTEINEELKDKFLEAITASIERYLN
ncbi:MAG: hypothetical protein JXA43_02500 [Candidatus Diapherotrites archaeon]|nr:hypothetical protein [Candidatus Diapherotrites archaeon]